MSELWQNFGLAQLDWLYQSLYRESKQNIQFLFKNFPP